MSSKDIYITGIGIIGPLGTGCGETIESIKAQTSALKPLTLFPDARDEPLPVGEVGRTFSHDPAIPRTHALAMAAAKEAMAGTENPPDAIVLGTTTGGMPTSEVLLKQDNRDPAAYRWHGAGSIAAYLAESLGCPGPALTVSTACSSGAVALAVAKALIQSGLAERVLAGGADALCRFIYYGFNSLQLLDPHGSRPLDKDRLGMSVAEGAAMLLLSGAEQAPPDAIARLEGGGMSCDAYHPTAPHPDGEGALQAMTAALEDAGVSIEHIDYLNLHGTGTRDNDAAEAKAVSRLFSDGVPKTSSIKGMTGHSLAAAGAIEAAVCSLCLDKGIVPANVGLKEIDPEMDLDPLKQAQEAAIGRAMSNSFGFGGNNAVLVLSRTDTPSTPKEPASPRALEVLSTACITGAGDLKAGMEKLASGTSLAGLLADEVLSDTLPARKVRRLKRLTRMTLRLAADTVADAHMELRPAAVFFSTGWGPLSETYDFLVKLFETDECFASPTDFVNSVYNAPAGQMAMWFGTTGINLTATGGDYSFEQALLTASLLAPADEYSLLVGADETHEKLSSLVDPDALKAGPADGGGAILVRPCQEKSGLRLRPLFYKASAMKHETLEVLIEAAGGIGQISEGYGALFVGIPAAHEDIARDQLAYIQRISGFSGPVIDYRRYTGQFASASATATVLALDLVSRGTIPGPICGGMDVELQGRGILILNLGRYLTAIEALASE